MTIAIKPAICRGGIRGYRLIYEPRECMHISSDSMEGRDNLEMEFSNMSLTDNNEQRYPNLTILAWNC